METILKSPLKDWSYIILSSLTGFVLVGFYFLLLSLTDKLTAFFITLGVFSVLFDIRHLFSTYTRTLLDKEFMTHNKKWFYRSWFFILFIPIVLMLLVSNGDFFAFNSTILMAFMGRLTFVLGFYHLVKQNWGFMAIYKKKMNEAEDGSDRVEKLLLLSGSFIPFVWISLKYPVWFPGEEYAFQPQMEQLAYVIELWKRISMLSLGIGAFFLLTGFAFKVVDQYKYVSRNLGYLFTGCFILIQIILNNGAEDTLTTILYGLVGVFCASLFFTIRYARNAREFNKGKWSVLISSLILYNGILLIPIEEKYVLVMAVTLPHNIQYLSFVKEFNERAFTSDKKDHGLAQRLTEKFILLLFVSLIYAALFELGRTGARFSPYFQQNDTLIIVRNCILMLFTGMVLHHYYLDAVIWRVRKDKSLSANL